MLKNLFYVIFLCCFLISFSSNLCAKDFTAPHKVKPGQTLSADVINEIIDALSFSEKVATRDDFLGTWACKKYTNANPDFLTSYTNKIIEQNSIYSFEGALEFKTDGSGNYTLTDTHPELLILDNGYNEEIVNLPYGVASGRLFFQYYKTFPVGSTPELIPGDSPVEFKGENQFIINGGYSGGSTVCDKTNLPPNIPEDIIPSVSSRNITISWTDKSDDETGFNVLRRDSLDAQWQEVANVDAVSGAETTVSYVDIGLSPGTYWYRVRAVNTNGKSLGSIVTKITVE